jgi:hypothetical protein
LFSRFDVKDLPQAEEKINSKAASTEQCNRQNKSQYLTGI